MLYLGSDFVQGHLPVTALAQQQVDALDMRRESEKRKAINILALCRETTRDSTRDSSGRRSSSNPSDPIVASGLLNLGQIR